MIQLRYAGLLAKIGRARIPGTSALTAASSLPETPDALAALVPLGRDIDAATGEGVAGLRAAGYSWADIVARLSITRQAAQQRWGGESG